MGSKNLEVEIKIEIKCQELENIENMLRKFNARFIREREEIDLYLNHPCKDMKFSDEALRIRYVDGIPETITYKGNRGNKNNPVKSREEIIVNVKSDPIPLLNKLGFSISIQVKKRRKYYDFDDVEITLDRVDNLGCFIEVESKNGSENEIKDALNKLAIKGTVIPSTYAEMLSNKIKH
ncbi:MAG: class IV adenylate cyclase [Caldisphaera sp.]